MKYEVSKDRVAFTVKGSNLVLVVDPKFTEIVPDYETRELDDLIVKQQVLRFCDNKNVGYSMWLIDPDTKAPFEGKYFFNGEPVENEQGDLIMKEKQTVDTFEAAVNE